MLEKPTFKIYTNNGMVEFSPIQTSSRSANGERIPLILPSATGIFSPLTPLPHISHPLTPQRQRDVPKIHTPHTSTSFIDAALNEAIIANASAAKNAFSLPATPTSPSSFIFNAISTSPVSGIIADANNSLIINILDTNVRSLPTSWYSSPHIYELERRSIFSNTWLYACPADRFQKTGDYVLLELAGFEFFIIRDQKGTLNAFHNICSHRGYTLIKKHFGNSKVIVCKYHGACYNTNGQV